MAELKNYREVGIFDLLSAPLNPIGAFDAEQFKKDARALIDENPDDKFVAVDLMGLDFVYSDAYNAFILFQQELAIKGGMLALLSNSKTIMDGLKKAGLDRKLKVFSFEAELMSFSLHPQEQEEAVAEEAPVEHKPTAVASQNGGQEPTMTRRERKTGLNRRFTKSFNAIIRNEDNLDEQGMDTPFSDKKGSNKVLVIAAVVVVALAGAAAALFL